MSKAGVAWPFCLTLTATPATVIVAARVSSPAAAAAIVSVVLPVWLPLMVTHGTPDAVANAQSEALAVTRSGLEPPPAPNVSRFSTAKVHGTPACATVTDRPPARIVATRATLLGFGLTANPTLPGPAAALLDVKVSQGASLVTAHPQPAPVPMLTDPVPPPELNVVDGVRATV